MKTYIFYVHYETLCEKRARNKMIITILNASLNIPIDKKVINPFKIRSDINIRPTFSCFG